VGHLREMAKWMGFPMVEGDLNFLGDPFDDFRKPLK